MALSEKAERLQRGKPDAAAWAITVVPEAIPGEVRRHARRVILDLFGAAAAGRTMASAEILYGFAASHCAAGVEGARLPFDGRRVSLPGAAMAAAGSIEAAETADDHRLAKGHAGAVILPALLAVGDEAAPSSGAELVTRFVVGCEIALRAGIALQEGSSSQHATGAWAAIGAAAASARALGLDHEAARSAMGAAEYFAPAAQAARCLDFPSMVRHGAASGAQAGVSAALLAQEGFAGAPALTVEDDLFDEVWDDLGSRWRLTEVSLRAWPVSRWALPAVEAACRLREEIAGRPIERLVVETFQEATRLSTTYPQTPEAAQFSLPFLVAATIVHGRVDLEIVTTGFQNAAVLALAEKVELSASQSLSNIAPARRGARLIAILADGGVAETPPVEARGEPERPLSDGDLINKFLALAEPVVGKLRALTIAEMASRLERLPEARPLIELIAAPPEKR
ncbi:MAG TPA: MmgE/PrpD family protein [Afifellaceae bacterium]|nr:MmgE/PrpD family protein [Afifellaceae bacterium]